MARYPGSFGPEDDHGIGDVARRHAQADVREQFGTGGKTQNLPEDYGTGYPEHERHDRDYREERYGPRGPQYWERGLGGSRTEPPDWRGDAGWGRPWSGRQISPRAWRDETRGREGRNEPPDWRGDAGWGRPWSGDQRGEPNAWRGDAGWGRGYHGRGPKNYTRSDARIQEDISERLWNDDDIDATDVSVEVKDGEVTLRGNVEHRSIKHRIEDIADSCGGVREIHNEIRVQRSKE